MSRSRIGAILSTIKTKAPSSSTAKSLSAPADYAEDLTRQWDDLHSILRMRLCGDASSDLQIPDTVDALAKDLVLPGDPDLPPRMMPLSRGEINRQIKLRSCFKYRERIRYAKTFAEGLGTEKTIKFIDKMEERAGVKAHNTMLKGWLERARIATDEVVAQKYLKKAYYNFKVKKDHGIQLEEETYGLFLEYFIDRGMTKEFFSFCADIENEDPSAASRLGYYKMKLWSKLNNDVVSPDEANKSVLQAAAALCVQMKEGILSMPERKSV